MQHGELRGYMLNWFGGMPIFYFYPPLAFWLMSLVAIILPHLSNALIFKGFLLLSLSSVPVAFHFFAQSFLPKKKINIFITFAVSLAYLFYQPFEYGSLGIGVAGAVPVGLIMTPLAMSTALVFLVYFKKLLTRPGSKILSYDFLWTVILGTLIIYLHILTMLFTAFFAALILFFYFKKENVKKSLYLLIALFLTGAYTLYPLFAYLGFSSGWRVDSLAYFHDPALPLLGFDISSLSRFDFFNFNWVWFFIFIFFIVGIIRLFKKRQFILPMLFFVSFIAVPRDFLARIFPTLPIHYYRIMPFIFFIYMAIAVFGIEKVFSYFSYKKFGIFRYFLGLILILVLAQQIYFFNFIDSGRNIKPRVIDSYLEPIQYYNNISKYPLAGSAKNSLKYFLTNNIKSRVVSASEGRKAEIELGSAHYFDTLLPMVNGTPSIFGLYAESAYQAPFLFPAVETLTNLRFAYGNIIALFTDDKYMSQPPSVAIKELGLFNANYFIADSRYSKQNFISASSTLERVDANSYTSPFEIYKNKNSVRGYISSPKYLPALYINEDDKLSFRNFALGWYKMVNILDFPVIFDGNGINNINKKNLNKISFVIIHSNHLSDPELSKLESLDKKIVVLSQGSYQGKLPTNISLIENFLPNSGYYGGPLPENPNYAALNKLEDIFKRMESSSINSQSSNQTDLKASVWQDQKIVFSGHGPIIVNAAYFPDWRSDDPNQEIYQVTPGQMLIFSQGNTILKFAPSVEEVVSGWVSVISIVLFIFANIYLGKEEKAK